MMKKIVIVGPESTGKSTLSQELSQHYANHYPTAWVPEYAREFLDELDRPYTYEDLLTIAKGAAGAGRTNRFGTERSRRKSTFSSLRGYRYDGNAGLV